MEEAQICPVCKGTGFITVKMTYIIFIFPKAVEQAMTCKVCKGEGLLRSDKEKSE